MDELPKSDVIREIFLNETTEVEAIEHNGSRDNLRIVGVIQVSEEDVNQKAVGKQEGFAFAMEEIILCHKLTTKKLGPETITEKFLSVTQNMKK